MENVKDALNNATSICNGLCQNYHEYSKIYTFTTENISGYIDLFDLRNKSLLTVGSSGDQILNAYLNGARDITLFDINEYAKYYIHLKVAAILTLDYNEFFSFFFKHSDNSYSNPEMFAIDTFKKIYPLLKIMDYESAYFFNELFNLYDSKLIRTHLFDDCERRNLVIKGFNNYLHSEETYNKLKKILYDISFKYINGNIFSDNISGKYDNIFLSNLCTTTSLKEFKKLLHRLNKNNLNTNGQMLIAYLWDTDFNSKYYKQNWKDIYKMPIVRKALRSYISKSYAIKSDIGFIWDEPIEKDLVLIYKKTK